MMFKSAVLASLAASVTATSFVPNEDIPVGSAIGQKLMSQARALEQADDMTWIANYSIKYLGCSSLIQVNGEGGGGEDQSLLYTQNLVKFALCDTSSGCSSCGNGAAQYVVPMMTFVDAWTESKMQAQERVCENVRENCYCENANDDEACEAACYQQLGMDYCIQYGDQENFEVQRYLECNELEGANGNNNNNNNGNGNGNYQYQQNYNNGVNMYAQYWMGPTCANDGKSINLAVFTDAGCTEKAGSGVYEAFNYGASLPYEKESLVDSSECMSCKQVNEDQNQNQNGNQNNGNQNNGNNYYNYNENVEVAEICDQTYEVAAKCETNIKSSNMYFTPDTSGCDYIKNILPRLSKASSKSGISTSSSASSGSAATAFAVIFFLTSCILGAYSFFLYRKIHRAKVNLAQSEGMTMA